MIVSSFSFGVSGDRLSSLSVAVTSILVHIDLHADVILCLRKFGQKTYCLHVARYVDFDVSGPVCSRE